MINAFPTGVEVSHAMHHGGPSPATSDARFTSVGTAALLRFARPVCYQGFPAALLPAALQDANPLGLMRLVNGVRTTGGRLAGSATVNLKTQPEALDKYKVDKGQFDAVFEASGSEAALRVGLDTIVPRGVLITVGMGGDISLPMTQIVAKEVDMRGTFRFHAEFATAVRFLNEGLVNGKPVITGVLPMDRAIEAFDLAADKSQSLKVQISFQNA